MCLLLASINAAAVAEEFGKLMTPLADAMAAEQTGIQTWCEAHRVDLCGEGDKLGKTANLVTGEVGWRMRPPSVKVRDAEGVIDTLIRMDMRQFVRTKEEVNKEAILADPERERGIAGISLVKGMEDFFVVPFEAVADAASLASVGAAARAARAPTSTPQRAASCRSARPAWSS